MAHLSTMSCLSVAALLVGGLSTGCGDSGTTAAGGNGGTGGTAATTGSTTDATSSTGTSGCSGATPVALTVKNYLAWCSVTVGTEAASSASTQTVCVAEGEVNLSAVALASFELGKTPWHDTDGDKGSGEQGTVTGSGQSASSATTVKVSGTKDCAWVCCETAGMTDCPTSDLCP